MLRASARLVGPVLRVRQRSVVLAGKIPDRLHDLLDVERGVLRVGTTRGMRHRGPMSTHVTEGFYRRVIVPAIRGGATVMDNVFGQP